MVFEKLILKWISLKPKTYMENYGENIVPCYPGNMRFAMQSHSVESHTNESNAILTRCSSLVARTRLAGGDSNSGSGVGRSSPQIHQTQGLRPKRPHDAHANALKPWHTWCKVRRSELHRNLGTDSFPRLGSACLGRTCRVRTNSQKEVFWGSLHSTNWHNYGKSPCYQWVNQRTFYGHSNLRNLPTQTRREKFNKCCGLHPSCNICFVAPWLLVNIQCLLLKLQFYIKQQKPDMIG